MYLKLGTLAMAVLVSFTPSGSAQAVEGLHLNSDSIFSWANASESVDERNFRILQMVFAADKAEVAEAIDEAENTVVRRSGGHTFSLDVRYLGNAIFDRALNSVGAWYSYSGVGPNYFDCSGLTMFVMKKFGVKLAHSATAQMNSGRVISESKAQYGDLVWMPGHIGFWAGDRLILDAQKPGTQVAVRKIWTSNYRIIRIVDVNDLVK